jgi:flagellar biosynthesis/type III secretory pathway protein FliH
MKRMLLAPAIGALMIATASPALAQWGGDNRRPTYGYGSGVETRRIGYDNGFREGIKEGEKDGRRGDQYRYQDEGDFRRADVGYRTSYGNRDLYRQAFRSGFADGYADGYRRYARNGRYGNDDRRSGSGGGGFGGILGRDPRNGQRRGYSLAYDNGVRDGLEKGREDIRKNRSFDARRHKWYREGDHNYNGRYGSRDQYKVEYRQGFNAGYDQGYRQGRYGY